MTRAPVLATIAALWALSPLPASGEPVPEPLAVVPSGPVTVIVGQTLELQASGGAPPYTWITLDPGVGVVDEAGVFLAVGAGSSVTTQVLVMDAVSCAATSGEITVPADSDGDGLPDTWELAHGLLIGEDDAAADADGDGATNAAEWGAGSTPTKADTDGDGMPDGWEIINGLSPVSPDGTADPDGDGLDNLREYLSGHDPHMSDAGIDTDGDGMDDVWEINHGLDPASPADAAADPDGDGLVNGIERLAGTSPHEANEHLPDADGDWMPDPWEIAWGTDPLVADHFVDADGDGFPHYLEYLLGTDPFGHNGALTDTDGDGMPDQWERTFALDPAVDDGDKDADADGRPNRVEYRGATNPTGKDADMDGDGMADRWEHGFAVSDPLGNPDNDHLSNVEEFNKGKNPQVLNPYTVGVDPSTAALEVGELVTLACTNAIGPCTWTSDAPGVATVAGGVVSGVAPGVALVTARDSNEIKGIGVVAVRESPVAGQAEPVGVHPTSAALVEGGRLSFAAFGGVRPYGAITSSDPAVVAVEADLDTTGAPVGTGWLAAGHAGQATVTVTDGGDATATITVTVAAGVVTVSPPALSLAVGESAGLWATGAAPLTFQSADSAVATVGASTGKVTAVAAGVTQVVVTDAFLRQAVVDVTVENPVLILAPEELTLAVGAGVALVAVGGVPPYSWASSDPAVSVEAGYALAVASGAAVVTVTDSVGQKATATVTVAAATKAEGCGAAPAAPIGALPVLATLVAVLLAVRLTFGPRRRRVGAPDQGGPDPRRTSMKRVATAVLVVLMLATLAHARTKEGVTMPDEVVLEGKKVVLNGMGLREATALNVDVYVAGLYLENKSSDGRAIAESNETKRLVLRFVRDVDGEDIANAWTEGFKKNSAAAVPALQARINKLNGWMQDVEDGQSLVFNYIPGKGLQVIVDGAKKGFIEGEDFQKAFFLIFLGDPPNAGLKSGLLGK